MPVPGEMTLRDTDAGERLVSPASSRRENGAARGQTSSVGRAVLDRIDEPEFGEFAWVIDPEGNEVELWQPPAGQ